MAELMAEFARHTRAAMRIAVDLYPAAHRTGKCSRWRNAETKAIPKKPQGRALWRSPAEQQVAEGREGKQQSEQKKKGSEGADPAQGDGLLLPASGENGPAEKPEGDGDGGDAGERAGGVVEGQKTSQAPGTVGGNGERAQGETAQRAGEDGGGGRAVRGEGRGRGLGQLRHGALRQSWMVPPPRTGAALVIIAPHPPAMAAARNATAANPRTTLRSCRSVLHAARWRNMTKPAMVAAIGANHATCSFHSMPSVCQPAVAGLDISRR